MGISRRGIVTVGLPTLLFGVACGSSDSRQGWDKSATFDTPGGPVPAFSNGGEAKPKNTESAASYVAPTELGCSSRAQQILILDFRSGWWAGGGGGGFTDTALKAVVGACPATSVDYHHFEVQTHVKCVYKSGPTGGCQTLNPVATPDDIRARFELKAVDAYTQIWVLSGSDQDKSDIQSGDALFTSVVADTRGACIPMLVAGGDGFVTHANSITSDIGMGNVFNAKTNPPSFFMSGFGVNQISKLEGQSLKAHLLWNGVPSITDRVSSMMQQARGDTLAAVVPEGHVYDVIATDEQGTATVAVGAAKVAGDGYRPFVFDSGWQRMYTLANDPGTGQYLKNLVMYMGLVGCKAAPIGPPK